ncbi:MAG: LysE family translocator [Parasphingorhabdus sp.]|uniref:LysE family translocator n=1 Tax=Parasphingorhabdus sp. TaxID=2709688 RepID=UPI0030016E10
MIASALPAFLLTAFLIELTPGPNMAFLIMVSAIEGRKSGIAMTAGIALGLTIIGFGAVLGLAALISASPFLFQFLRWAGALYLVWLAAEAWISANEVSPSKVTTNHSNGQLFRRGLITNLLNPKAGLFFVAVLPGFTTPDLPVLPQAMTLTILYVAVATLIHLIIVMLAGQANSLVSSEPRKRFVRRFFAIMLLGIAIWFLAMSR